MLGFMVFFGVSAFLGALVGVIIRFGGEETLPIETPKTLRHREALRFSAAGIKDWRNDRGMTALDTVMAAHGLALEAKFGHG